MIMEIVYGDVVSTVISRNNFAKIAVAIMEDLKIERSFIMKMDIKKIKILGILGTLLGLGATLLTDYVDEKKMEETIDEKIDEKLKERMEIEEV